MRQIRIGNLSASIGANRVVVALSVARLADAIGNSILLVTLPLYIASLPSHLLPFPESVLVGIVLSLYGLAFTLFQPLFGALTDRFRVRKPFITGGLILMSASTWAFVYAERFLDILFLRTVQGLAVAITIPASMALMTAATEKKSRGGAMGIYSTLRLVGLGIGPLVGGYLQVYYSFNAAFTTGALMVLLSVLLVQSWVDESALDEPDMVPAPFRLFDREALDAGVLWLMVATAMMASGFTMVNALENEFNSRLQQTALAFGFAFSALVAGRLVLQVPMGSLSDRIGRKPVIIAGLILLGVATAALGQVRTTMQFAGARLFQGFATAAVGAPILALTADSSQIGSEGRRLSVVNAGFGLGIMVGPLLAGVLATAFFELPFLLGGIGSIFGAFIIYRFVPETVRLHGQEGAPGSSS